MLPSGRTPGSARKAVHKAALRIAGRAKPGRSDAADRPDAGLVLDRRLDAERARFVEVGIVAQRRPVLFRAAIDVLLVEQVA